MKLPPHSASATFAPPVDFCMCKFMFFFEQYLGTW